MLNPPLVTVLILNYNGMRVLKKCLEKVYCQTYPNIEVILTDNASTDSSLEMVLHLFPHVKIVKTGKNLGYAGGNNFGALSAHGAYLAILNNDAYPEATCLSKVIPFFLNDSSVAVVGCKIYREGTQVLDSAGAYIDFPIGFAPGRGAGQLGSSLYEKVEEIAYVGGAAMVVRRDVFHELMGFDESYCSYHEEVDLCWRARILGYKVLYVPNAIVEHEVSQTLGERNLIKDYLIERNRIITNIKNLKMINLLYALFYEALYAFGKILLSARYRKIQIMTPYIKAVTAVLLNFKIIWKRRKSIQVRRRVSDKYVLSLHRRKGIVEYIRAAKSIQF